MSAPPPDAPARTVSPRFGLCCTFAEDRALRFRTTTIAHLSKLVEADPTQATAISFYEELIMANLDTLRRVLDWCALHDIHAFRIGSDLWPRATHPLVRPWVDALFESSAVRGICAAIRAQAVAHDIRLSEHPDQFLVGNSLRADVVNGTIAELDWRGQLGEALGVDVICLHVGSGAPDRESALWRWEAALERLTPAARARLAFENDDRVFSPEAILPACMAWGLPLIYDAHHHRVLPDTLTEDDATELAIASWGDREPYFHLSSPRSGWDGSDARPHHLLIEVHDWPTIWSEMMAAGMRFTVDIEAKGKELAIFALRAGLAEDRAVHVPEEASEASAECLSPFPS